MWHFSRILGLGMACTYAILNATWFELDADQRAADLPANRGNLA